MKKKIELEFTIPEVSEQTRKDAWSMIAGAVAFGSTLAVSTLVQGKVLGISTGTPPPLPTMMGVATVCLASLASHRAAIVTREYLQTGVFPQRLYLIPPHTTTMTHRNDDFLDLRYVKVPMQTIRICAVGLLTFKLLGGRFWAIAPSSYTHLGSFASKSLPATAKYATASQRAALDRLGRIYGCHTCGSHMWWFRRITGSANAAVKNKISFVGDHMPPKAVADQINRRWYNKMLGRAVQFRFYPQCINCSTRQGTILSQATVALRDVAKKRKPLPNLHQAGGGSKAYCHGLRFRTNHLTGAVLAAAAVVNVNDATDLEVASMLRYGHWQQQVQDWMKEQRKKIKKAFPKR